MFNPKTLQELQDNNRDKGLHITKWVDKMLYGDYSQMK
jgi:hypothetical protein